MDQIIMNQSFHTDKTRQTIHQNSLESIINDYDDEHTNKNEAYFFNKKKFLFH